MKQRYIILDVETTGLSAARGGRIIEIGAIVVEDAREVGEFQSLIDPGVRITLKAERIHGITNQMIAGKPKAHEVLPGFHRLIGNSTIVAHNARFDVMFLRHEFSRIGLDIRNHYCCTLAKCRKYFPDLRDHRLETVYRHLFGSPPEGTRFHRALDDARMVMRVWMEMLKRVT